MFSFFKKPQSYYEDDEIERRMKEKNLKKKIRTRKTKAATKRAIYERNGTIRSPIQKK